VVKTNKKSAHSLISHCASEPVAQIILPIHAIPGCDLLIGPGRVLAPMKTKDNYLLSFVTPNYIKMYALCASTISSPSKGAAKYHSYRVYCQVQQ